MSKLVESFAVSIFLEGTLLYATLCKWVLYTITVVKYSIKFSRKHLQCSPTFSKVVGGGHQSRVFPMGFP